MMIMKMELSLRTGNREMTCSGVTQTHLRDKPADPMMGRSPVLRQLLKRPTSVGHGVASPFENRLRSGLAMVKGSLNRLMQLHGTVQMVGLQGSLGAPDRSLSEGQPLLWDGAQKTSVATFQSQPLNI